MYPWSQPYQIRRNFNEVTDGPLVGAAFAAIARRFKRRRTVPIVVAARAVASGGFGAREARAWQRQSKGKKKKKKTKNIHHILYVGSGAQQQLLHDLHICTTDEFTHPRAGLMNGGGRGHAPSTSLSSPGRQRFGVEAVSFGPGIQRGPSAVVGSGIKAHCELGGYVPSRMKVPATGTRVPIICTQVAKGRRARVNSNRKKRARCDCRFRGSFTLAHAACMHICVSGREPKAH